MAAPRKYPEELRERAIRLTLDARKDPASRPSAWLRIGEQPGINPETLQGWVTQAAGSWPRAREGSHRPCPAKPSTRDAPIEAGAWAGSGPAACSRGGLCVSRAATT